MLTYLLFIITSAITDFSRNKIRTFLTSLGILIGVLSVVLIIAFGLGLKKSIQGQFEQLGTNQLILFPGQVISNGSFRNSGGNLSTIRFDERDVQSLKRVKELQYVVPVSTKSVKVSAFGKAEFGDLYMTNADIFPARSLVINQGKEFSKEDVDKRSRVVVLGSKISDKIFGSATDAVGKTIKVDKQSFKVIGVLKSVGSSGLGGPDLDSYVYLPYKTGYIFNTDKKFGTFILKADPTVDTAIAKKEIKDALLKRYKEDDFSIVELTEIQNAVTSIFGILNTVLIGISTISLLVGGIGIMNIMYVTVTERTKEIGVRRALGARRSDILMQFIVEAVVLSLFGGLMGLLLSFVIVFGVQQFFPAYIDTFSVFLALGVSSSIGIIFGVFPARKASMLSPIEAIRYE